MTLLEYGFPTFQVVARSLPSSGMPVIDNLLSSDIWILGWEICQVAQGEVCGTRGDASASAVVVAGLRRNKHSLRPKSEG